ncbi:hypothetical protein [Acetobacter conturbans]|uniref:Uncharacterized protein n=1 Tax=Acetobacter conturbans TaxID=1737472 RepID=A0ABX0K6W9_9PROT|nr:hypothetical protein [Acetobacter conturbans]NHN90123.1 hypothetical protein [Acetobacter conturbans]
MNIDLSSDLISTRFSAELGLIKPTATATSTSSTSITSANANGAATILDTSSTTTSSVYKSDGPIVLIPEGNRYVPISASTEIDGKAASQIKGAITVNGDLETDLTSSSSSLTLYTASGSTTAQSTQTVSNTSDRKSEEELIAKLFSSPTDKSVDGSQSA